MIIWSYGPIFFNFFYLLRVPTPIWIGHSSTPGVLFPTLSAAISWAHERVNYTTVYIKKQILHQKISFFIIPCMFLIKSREPFLAQRDAKRINPRFQIFLKIPISFAFSFHFFLLSFPLLLSCTIISKCCLTFRLSYCNLYVKNCELFNC